MSLSISSIAMDEDDSVASAKSETETAAENFFPDTHFASYDDVAWNWIQADTTWDLEAAARQGWDITHEDVKEDKVEVESFLRATVWTRLETTFGAISAGRWTAQLAMLLRCRATLRMLNGSRLVARNRVLREELNMAKQFVAAACATCLSRLRLPALAGAAAAEVLQGDYESAPVEVVTHPLAGQLANWVICKEGEAELMSEIRMACHDQAEVAKVVRPRRRQLQQMGGGGGAKSKAAAHRKHG